jgi:hypothetical protein
VLAKEADHLVEVCPAALLRGFDVDVFLDDLDVLGFCIVAQELELRRNRIALTLLLLRRNARVEDAALGRQA